MSAPAATPNSGGMKETTPPKLEAGAVMPNCELMSAAVPGEVSPSHSAAVATLSRHSDAVGTNSAATAFPVSPIAMAKSAVAIARTMSVRRLTRLNTVIEAISLGYRARPQPRNPPRLLASYPNTPLCQVWPALGRYSPADPLIAGQGRPGRPRPAIL